MKLNLGCGTDIREGYTNVDSAPLPGVDVVHNLTDMPWPLPNGCADEIVMINVLEHLPDTIAAVEEIRRICKPGATVRVRVPYYNSPDMFADPTHKSFFSERTLHFFDPRRKECQSRPYYSAARFEVTMHTVYCRFFIVYVPFRLHIMQRFLLWFGRRISPLVWVIEFELKAV